MPFNVPGAIPIPFTIAGRRSRSGRSRSRREVVLVGAGALMSFRTAGRCCSAACSPTPCSRRRWSSNGVITAVSYKAIVGWTVWPGAAILVAAGLTSFALDYRSVARSFSGLGRAIFGIGGRTEVAHPIDAVECPGWWFPAGLRRARAGDRGAHVVAVPDPRVGGHHRRAARGGDGLRRGARHRRDRRDADQGARPGDADDLRRRSRPATSRATSCRRTSPAASACTPPTC